MPLSRYQDPLYHGPAPLPPAARPTPAPARPAPSRAEELAALAAQADARREQAATDRGRLLALTPLGQQALAAATARPAPGAPPTSSLAPYRRELAGSPLGRLLLREGFPRS